LSDRNAKENFAPTNPREVLDKVAALPLATWNYKTQDKSIRHIGPTAQDFHTAFGVGENDRTITTVNAAGVALAAIQGLNQKVASLEKELVELKELVRRLRKD
jgi:trimeric autotransporter adhesin